MANPAHLEKLREGPRAWNAWREANPDVLPDLSEVQLTLHQRQLGPSNGGPVNFHATDLEQAVLRYATLSGANLEAARLVGADLTHARLDGARLIGADLTDALLDQADLTGALLDQAVLFGTDLSNTRNLTIEQLEQAFGDTGTKLPGNLLPPEAWFPKIEEDEDDYAGWDFSPYEEPLEQSLYDVLGLTQKAESEEIRSAYRGLVKKLHPDINPNDKAAQDRFGRVTTAYRILSDAEQRARYDKGEIDGEGRVNPEFEARRRFQRTTYRYYAAAAGSFLLAAAVLVGVWYTVLSLDGLDESAPQVATVAQPKRSERLGDERPASERVGIPTERLPAGSATDANKDVVLLTEKQPAAEQPPVAQPPVAQPSLAQPAETQNPVSQPAETQPAARPDTLPVSEADSKPAPQGPPASPLAIGGPEASKPLATPPPKARDAQASKPADAAKVGASGVQAHLEPAAGNPKVPDDAVAGAARGQQQTMQPTPPPGGTPNPLQEEHKTAAGQTASSAPDGWSVAALPPAAQQDSAEQRIPQARTDAGVDDRRVEKSAVPPSVQRPAGRDIVSKVLRARAFRQALGERNKRSLLTVEGGAASERRAGLGADLPTNALPLPGRRQDPSIKPTASLQRKPPESRASPRAQAASGKVDAATEGQKRESRQQQAVSDILSGGL